MQFIALKELPKGTQPGEAFEATEAEGDVLVLVGAATKAALEPDAIPIDVPTPRRRTYQRRDLVAEE